VLSTRHTAIAHEGRVTVLPDAKRIIFKLGSNVRRGKRTDPSRARSKACSIGARSRLTVPSGFSSRTSTLGNLPLDGVASQSFRCSSFATESPKRASAICLPLWAITFAWRSQLVPRTRRLYEMIFFQQIAAIVEQADLDEVWNSDPIYRVQCCSPTRPGTISLRSPNAGCRSSA